MWVCHGFLLLFELSSDLPLLEACYGSGFCSWVIGCTIPIPFLGNGWVVSQVLEVFVPFLIH